MLLDKKRIKKVKENLSLPTEASFCGFIIHIPENDEFIANITENNSVKIIGYTPTPNYALKYNRYDKALKNARKCEKHKTVIGYLFDLEDLYCVGFEE